MGKPTYTKVQWDGIEAGQWAADGVIETAAEHAENGFTAVVKRDLKTAKGDARDHFNHMVFEGRIKKGDWKEFRDAFEDARARILEENDIDPAVIRRVFPAYDKAPRVQPR